MSVTGRESMEKGTSRVRMVTNSLGEGVSKEGFAKRGSQNNWGRGERAVR